MSTPYSGSTRRYGLPQSSAPGGDLVAAQLSFPPLSSWFVAVTQFRDRMVTLNQKITWVPDQVGDGQFGTWLAGACGLTGGRSVHLAEWPDPATLSHDRDLVASMDRARQVVSAALSVRKARRLRVRQPLSQLIVAAPDASTLMPLSALIRGEVNVRSVKLTVDVAAYGRFELTVNARACGPRCIDAPAAVHAAAREHERFVAGEVLAHRVDYAPVPDGFAGVVGDGVEVRVAATRLVSA